MTGLSLGDAYFKLDKILGTQQHFGSYGFLLFRSYGHFYPPASEVSREVANIKKFAGLAARAVF